MKLDSKWKESIRETADIFLALIGGIVIENSIDEGVRWLIVGALLSFGVVVGTALVLRWRKKKKDLERFTSLVVKGGRWVIDVLAGLSFGISVALILFFKPFESAVGVILGALYFGLVASIVRYSKTFEDENKTTEKGSGKGKLSERIGITKETAGQLLDELFERKVAVQKRYSDLQDKLTGNRIETLDMVGLRQERE